MLTLDEVFSPAVLSCFVAVLDLAIETEVSMEVIRQKLAARKEFDIGKAFLTMLAAQRDGSDRDASPSSASPRSSVVSPAARAISAAASNDICGVAIKR